MWQNEDRQTFTPSLFLASSIVAALGARPQSCISPPTDSSFPNISTMTDQLAARLHDILTAQNERRHSTNGWRANEHGITLFHEQDDTQSTRWRLIAKISYGTNDIEIVYKDYIDGVFIWTDNYVSLADPDMLHKVQKHIDMAYKLDRHFKR
jgi:hypothetical protein